MLKTLRTKTRKVMLATLILVIPSFVLFYGWGSMQERKAVQSQRFARFLPPSGGPGLSGWVDINSDDMARTRQQMTEQAGRLYGPGFANTLSREADASNVFPVKDALQEAMNQWFLEQYARDQKITVSTAELRDLLRSSFKGMSKSEIVYAIQQSGYNSPAAFEAHMLDTERANRSAQLFTARARVSYYDLYDQFLVQKQELRMDYLSYQVEDYKPRVQVTDALLQAHLQANGEKKFRVGDQRRYRYALFPKSALESQIPPATSETLKAFYEDRKEEIYAHERQIKVSRILIPVASGEGMKPEEAALATSQSLTRAQLIHAQLTAGGDFAKTADQINTTGTLPGVPAGKGGLVDMWLTQQNAQPLGYGFFEAASKLEKGQISDPVEIYTQSGPAVAIIRCEEVRPAGISPYAEVLDRLPSDYRFKTLDALFEARREELADKVSSYSTIPSLAQALKMQDGVTSWVLTTSPLLAPSLYVEQADLGALKDLRKGDMSPLLQTPQVLYVVLVEDEKPAHVPTDLNEIRARVEQDYRTQQALELAKADAEAYRAKVTSQDFPTTASAADARTTGTPPVLATPLFTRDKAPSDFPGSLIDLVNQTRNARVGQIALSKAGSGPEDIQAYVVWCLRTVTEPTRDEFLKELPALERGMLVARQQTILQEWLADQRASTKVEENETLVQ